VVDDRLPVLAVRVNGVRVIAEAGDRDAALAEGVDDLLRPLVRQPVDVDVADAAVAAGRPLTARPNR